MITEKEGRIDIDVKVVSRSGKRSAEWDGTRSNSG
jgi:hypothetical protein